MSIVRQNVTGGVVLIFIRDNSGTTGPMEQMADLFHPK